MAHHARYIHRLTTRTAAGRAVTERVRDRDYERIGCLRTAAGNFIVSRAAYAMLRQKVTAVDQTLPQNMFNIGAAIYPTDLLPFWRRKHKRSNRRNEWHD